MTVIYNFPDSRNAYLPTTANHSVIHASIYLTEVVNAALTDKFLPDPKKRKAMLETVAKELADKFSSSSHMRATLM